MMMNLQSGQFLQGGKYKIVSVLGQGGFGITYLAEQVAMERYVAIKEFFLSDYCDRAADGHNVTLGTQNNAEMMARYMAKFKKEAKLIAKLNHPNVIRVFDVFDENNTAYYVMDYLQGQPLSKIVSERGALPEAEAIHYIYKVGQALEYIHKSNVNHLDVKPSNIMVCADGNPVLIDFGVSKQYDSTGQQTSSTPVGISEGYAPSEQYNKGGVSEFSPQADIYSLGATLYNLVTGKVPPSALDVLNDGFPPLPAHLAQGTKDAIFQAMQPRKYDRPATVSAFLNLLNTNEVVDTSGDVTRPLSQPKDERTVVVGEGKKPKPSTPPRSSLYFGLSFWGILGLFALISIFPKECGNAVKHADDWYADSLAADTANVDSAYVEEVTDSVAWY